MSAGAEKSVKDNVELVRAKPSRQLGPLTLTLTLTLTPTPTLTVTQVRRPSQQLGSHFNDSFKGVVKENRP